MLPASFLSVSERLGRVDCRAGARPKMNAVTNATTTENRSTLLSRAAVIVTCASSVGRNWSSVRSSQTPRPRPRVAAAADIIRLSIINSPTTCFLLAPRASLTAISFLRAGAARDEKSRDICACNQDYRAAYGHQDVRRFA